MHSAPLPHKEPPDSKHSSTSAQPPCGENLNPAPHSHRQPPTKLTQLWPVPHRSGFSVHSFMSQVITSLLRIEVVWRIYRRSFQSHLCADLSSKHKRNFPGRSRRLFPTDSCLPLRIRQCLKIDQLHADFVAGLIGQPKHRRPSPVNPSGQEQWKLPGLFWQSPSQSATPHAHSSTSTQPPPPSDTKPTRHPHSPIPPGATTQTEFAPQITLSQGSASGQCIQVLVRDTH